MVDKVATGIKGLDDMLRGGFPKGHVVAVIGSFGTGKTTFALQFLWQGLQNGEKAIFISLEEDEDSVKKSASTFEWDLEKHIASKELFIVQLTPEDMSTSVQRISSDLPEKIRQFGAARVAMDSVSLFSMLQEDTIKQRTSLFELARTIRSSGATSVFTAEASQTAKASRDGLVEYVADGVVYLRLHEDERTGDVKPVMQVLKMRRTDHIREMRPYAITASGIVVYPEARAN